MNENIRNLKEEVISKGNYVLKNVRFDIKKKDGSWQSQERVVFDHGNAVTVLLYNKEKRTIILTPQFRIASFMNGNDEGKIIETCAGLLEDSTPEAGIKREIIEETGYEINDVKKVFEVYSSPGVYTELLHYFVAEYHPDQKVAKGGGLEEEQEEVDILEIEFDKAYGMIETAKIKDAKTILLLQYAKLNGLV